MGMIDTLFEIRAPSTEFKAHLLSLLESIAAWYSKHDFIGNPSVLEWLLGRPATSFEQFVAREVRQARP